MNRSNHRAITEKGRELDEMRKNAEENNKTLKDDTTTEGQA